MESDFKPKILSFGGKNLHVESRQLADRFVSSKEILCFDFLSAHLNILFGDFLVAVVVVSLNSSFHAYEIADYCNSVVCDWTVT